MKHINIPQLDHCEPGFGNSIGSQDEWNNAYKKWLHKRGFYDELRMMELASRRGIRNKKKSNSAFESSNRD